VNRWEDALARAGAFFHGLHSGLITGTAVVVSFGIGRPDLSRTDVPGFFHAGLREGEQILVPSTKLNDAPAIALCGFALRERHELRHRLAFLSESNASFTAGFGLAIERLGDGRRAADFADGENIDLKATAGILNDELVTGTHFAGRLGTEAVGLNSSEIAGM